MLALYAFCRVIDDVVDLAHDPQIAQLKLRWWQTEIERLFNGDPQHPITQALQGPIEEFKLPMQPFLDILQGMLMDLEQNTYQNFDELYLYCYRVASTVGLLTARILGYQDSSTLIYAEKLGICLQLINIIRDVGQDAANNRIYLPMDELKASNIRPRDILSHKSSPELKQYLRKQCDRARFYYQEAMDNLPDEDKRRQKVGLVMAHIYLELLRCIELEGMNSLNTHIQVPSFKQLLIALKTWLFVPQYTFDTKIS